MVHILMLEPIPMLVPAPSWSRLEYRLFWSVTNQDSDSGKNWNHITLSFCLMCGASVPDGAEHLGLQTLQRCSNFHRFLIHGIFLYYSLRAFCTSAPPLYPPFSVSRVRASRKRRWRREG